MINIQNCYDNNYVKNEINKNCDEKYKINKE